MNNNDLFNMFGIEEPKTDIDNNNQKKIDENNNQPPSQVDSSNTENQQPKTVKVESQTQPQQINNPSENNQFVKPIPDEIMEEVHKKNNKDKELLNLYIGQNYESLAYGGFSFCTFFLGACYLVYRKQYGSAFILLILNIAISLSPLLNQPSISLILIIINFLVYVYFCIRFKTTYVTQAKETINRIMLQQLSTEEKHEMIKKAGGIDNRAFIFYILMLVITSAISYFVLTKTFV